MAVEHPSRRDVLKRMARAVAAGSALPLLAACTSPDDDARSPISSSDLDGAALEAVLRGSFIPEMEELTLGLVNRWQSERNATIDVTLTQDFRTIVPKIARDRRGADLGDLHGNAPHIWSDRLVDVSEVAERIGDALGGWAPAARDTCMVDGVWRAVPWSTTRHALVTRTDLLDEVGAPRPETYDDLLEAATLLHDAGAPTVGFTMGTVGPSDASALAYGLLWSFGGQEVTPQGAVALESAETMQALEFFQALARVSAANALEFGHPDNNAAYLDGTIAMTQNPSSIYFTALELGLPLAAHTSHLPLPAGPAGRFQLPEMNSIGVFRHSPDPAAALDFVEFVNGRQALIDRARESIAFHAPLVLGLDDDPQMPWKTDDRLAGLASTAAEGRMPGWPRPPNLEAGLVYQNHSIVKMFSAVGSGEMSPSLAMSTAADELRRVYET